jgi:hypothetical protein
MKKNIKYKIFMVDKLLKKNIKYIFYGGKIIEEKYDYKRPGE